LVPSDFLGSWGFIAIRCLFAGACILVGFRRSAVIVPVEAWVLCNLVVLFNPFYQFRLYERQRWAWVDLGTAALLITLLHRTEKPDSGWRSGLVGFLIAVYVFSLFGKSVIVDPEWSEIVWLPIRLAGGVYVAVCIVALGIGLMGGVRLLARKLRSIVSRRGDAPNESER